MKLPSIIAAVAAEALLVAVRHLLDRAQAALGSKRTETTKGGADQTQTLKPSAPS